MKAEKKIGDFIAQGKEVPFNEEKVRPDVKVQVISAKINEIGPDTNGTVKVSATVPGLKFPFHGYLSVNSPVYTLVTAAKEKDLVVCLRFEQKRKKTVDPTLGIAGLTANMDVARTNTVKVLIGIWSDQSNSWILADEAQTSASEDPAHISAAIASLDNNVNPETFFDAPAKAPVANSFGVSKSQDSGVNAIINVYTFVKEQELKNNFTLQEDVRRRVAVTLMNACNFLQMQMYNMATPRPEDYSHTRARFMLFNYCENFVPLDAKAVANLKTWGSEMVATVTELWKWGFAQWEEMNNNK